MDASKAPGKGGPLQEKKRLLQQFHAEAGYLWFWGQAGVSESSLFLGVLIIRILLKRVRY